MIDTHCHLEQDFYDKDRDSVIEKCRKEMDAVITSAAHPSDFKPTMDIVEKHPKFVYATVGIHPMYVKELADLGGFQEFVRGNSKRIVGIGECGTDYWYVTEPEWRERQRLMFVELINLAEETKLPLVIHCRNGQDEANAVEDAIKILEECDAKGVQMHMFSSRQLLQRVLKNGWMVSVNTLLTRSKSVKKVVRDCSLEQMMLETDAPWLGLDKEGVIRDPREVRNDPTAVKIVARGIAEIKKVSVEEVDRQTTENARKFFSIKK